MPNANASHTDEMANQRACSVESSCGLNSLLKLVLNRSDMVSKKMRWLARDFGTDPCELITFVLVGLALEMPACCSTELAASGRSILYALLSSCAKASGLRFLMACSQIWTMMLASSAASTGSQNTWQDSQGQAVASYSQCNFMASVFFQLDEPS